MMDIKSDQGQPPIDFVMDAIEGYFRKNAGFFYEIGNETSYGLPPTARASRGWRRHIRRLKGGA